MLNTVPPWVIVAGGFHESGGMDRANAALADYLLTQNVPVHLVAHRIHPRYRARDGVTAHLVTRPVSSYFLGERRLRRMGANVARAVTAKHVQARVVVNGGNCLWPDINWVHSVHHAWPCADQGSPLWFKAKNRVVKAIAKRAEKHAVTIARVSFANSERTRRDLIGGLNADPERVHTVYLGSEASWNVPSSSERFAARRWLEISDSQPVVVFVGALSYDDNKGFGTLWRAWMALSAETTWDACLVVAGEGNGLASWKTRVARAGLAQSVRFLGHTDEVARLLAAADVLVSPVRYEAYGLNVQEALCRGVPALVSAHAGVAERYSHDLQALLLADPVSVNELAAKLMLWRENLEVWRTLVLPLSLRLRSYTWSDMATRIVELAQRAPQTVTQPAAPPA